MKKGKYYPKGKQSTRKPFPAIYQRVISFYKVFIQVGK